MQNAEIVESQRAVDFLPPHSLYKLEVENIYGQMINFSKFQGMITLVVNVACSWGKTKVSYTELGMRNHLFQLFRFLAV